MTIKRVEIESVVGSKHGPTILEGEITDKLPDNLVFINPTKGTSLDGARGNTLQDLEGGEIEIPLTTWYWS